MNKWQQTVLDYAKRALSTENARDYDGDPNFRYALEIQTAFTGSYHDSPGGFAFEARVPRSAVNDLGCAVVWGGDGTVSRSEAAAFLRALADIVETPQAAVPIEGWEVRLENGSEARGSELTLARRLARARKVHEAMTAPLPGDPVPEPVLDLDPDDEPGHAPTCASFDFDPEKQLGPDKPCDCRRRKP